MRMTKTWVLLLLCQALAACSQMAVQPKTAPDFPPKLDTRTCHTNGACSIDVFARINESGRCEVMAEYKTVRVLANKTPLMMWSIESLMPAGTHEFQFEFAPGSSPPRYGIEIVNATPQDFDTPGFGGSSGNPNKQVFTWKNRHGRSLPNAPFDYNIRVQSRPHGGGSWTQCDPVDPFIVNE